MRSFLYALVGGLGAVTCVFALPLNSDAGSSGVNGTLVRFSISCPDCSAVAGPDLDFDLDIPASDFECTYSLPSLNGVTLDPKSSHIKEGTVSLNATQTSGHGVLEISAFWQKRCLRGEASLFSVSLKLEGVSPTPTESHSGFAISFKQSPVPKIIRLQKTPVSNIDSGDITEYWLSQSEGSHLKIVPHIEPPSPTPVSSLQSEYQKLEQLKKQIHQVHHEIHVQESKILLLLKDDFKVCEDFICYIRTAVKKTPDFIHFLQTHFRNDPLDAKHPSYICSSAKTNHVSASNSQSSRIVTPTPSPRISAHNPNISQTSSTGSSKERLSPCSDHPDGCHRFLLPPPPHFDADDFMPPHREGDQAPPFEDSSDRGPPKEDSHRDHFHHHRPPWVDDKEGMHHWSGGPPHHRPHIQHPAPRHPHFRLIFAVATFLITTTILAILIKLLHIYLSNPRVRADRAARAEECRTRRAFRRAACRHKFKQMFTGFRRRRGSGNGDYEEKRSMLAQRGRQRSDSGSIVRSDIRSLRRAHEIVGELMRAEEGRYNNGHQNEHRFNVSELPATSSSAASVSTLPAYAPPPPRYSQELSRDMEVVDGFRYTPSNSEATITSSASSFVINDDDMTSSSVVDCGSRMSFETESAPQSKKSLELAGDRMRYDY